MPTPLTVRGGRKSVLWKNTTIKQNDLALVAQIDAGPSDFSSSTQRTDDQLIAVDYRVNGPIMDGSMRIYLSAMMFIASAIRVTKKRKSVIKQYYATEVAASYLEHGVQVQ